MATIEERLRRARGSYFPGASQVIPNYSRGGVLPPEQNPAYQAAINRLRPQLTTITLPSGGTTTVPASSAAAVRAIPGISNAFDRAEIQGRLSYPQNYAIGYGAPPPAAPVTPQQRVISGQAGFGEMASVAAKNIFGIPQNQGLIGGLGRNIYNWFGGGGNAPGAPGSFSGTSAAGAAPSPPPIPTGSPTPTPTIPPQANIGFGNRFASERGDLMNDINGTFYGGGQAPPPTPTPSPVQTSRLTFNPAGFYPQNAGYAYNNADNTQPRRYFDF